MLNYNVFKKHLDVLLTLQNPTHSVDNPVQVYCLEVLHKLGLGEHVTYDKHGNILYEPGTVNRAIVAHTDSVMQYKGKPREAVNFANGIYSSKTQNRPIGGDDKVGVAVALTIIQSNPRLACLLFADEESGCIGSQAATCEFSYYLAVQCDRKGCNDLVADIYGCNLATQSIQKKAKLLLPHRDLVDGGLTDVLTLIERGVAENAFNMSAGYYNPHSVTEFVVLSHAWQACEDAYNLLSNVPDGLGAAWEEGRSSRWSLYGSDYDDWDDALDPWDKSKCPMGGTVSDMTGDGTAKSLTQLIEDGPFGDDPSWEEDGFGGYVNRLSNESVTPEEVQAYFEMQGQSVLDLTAKASNNTIWGGDISEPVHKVLKSLHPMRWRRYFEKGKFRFTVDEVTEAIEFASHEEYLEKKESEALSYALGRAVPGAENP